MLPSGRRNQEMRVAVVKAAHDDEAGVWYVEHSDVDGLHVEGETFEAFRHNVASAVEDLLEGEGGEVQIEIIAHASIRARVAA
jgi:predicted RNase H-like HicB family nuclease